MDGVYGDKNVTHDVHSLLQLANDVTQFGHLNNYSAFKFQNYMLTLKKMVKKGSHPVQQILNRLKEKEHHQQPIKKPNYTEFFYLSQTYPNNQLLHSSRKNNKNCRHKDVLTGHV